MAEFRNPTFGKIVETTLKQAAAALRDANVSFCLIGSLAAWVRGGPESSHDLDFGIREVDLVRAAEALEGIGMTIEVPPEDWLIKAWNGDPSDPDAVMVDLIYSASGLEIDDDVLARADELQVLSHGMLVINASDLLITKLLALREQHLTYTSTVATARAIREQIEWDEVRRRTQHSPYAAAFFTMAERLAICPPPDGATPDGAVDPLAALRADAPGGREYRERRRLVEYLASREGGGAIAAAGPARRPVSGLG